MEIGSSKKWMNNSAIRIIEQKMSIVEDGWMIREELLMPKMDSAIFLD